MNKFTKDKETRRIASFSMVAIIVVAITSFVVFAIIFSTNSEKAKQQTKNNKQDIGSVVISEKDEAAKQAESPTTGPLDHHALTTYVKPGGKNIIYIYTTKEYRDDRLIELNDLVMSELREENKIDDTTKLFTISYFSDKDIAMSYFPKVNDKSTTENDKLLMKNSYVATMMYSEQLGLKSLIKINNGKILKQY